jgi:hypothetical protein
LRYHDKPYVLELSIPALCAVFFKNVLHRADIKTDKVLIPAGRHRADSEPTHKNGVLDVQDIEKADKIYNIDGLRLFNYGEDEDK